MKKDFLLFGNFKNNVVDAKEYQSNFGKTIQNNVVVFPNFCDIKDFEILKKNGIKIGAQNVSEFATGSHTAEITVDMLKKYGVEFCIVGHSERRKDFAETHKIINQKIRFLVQNVIVPVLCVGENVSTQMTQIEYAKKVVDDQLGNELVGIDKNKLIVAYEPVWAIGTGNVADNLHISMICKYIKNKFDIKTILYGGSVNAKNIGEIAKIDSVDGVLIGKASLDSKNIIEMQNN